MKALIIVDVQNDFISGALPVPGAAEVVPVINELAKEYDVVVATADWHQPDDPEFQQFPPHCQAGSDGADFPADLDLSRIDGKVFTKAHFSGFSNETLSAYLISRGVTTVHVVGLATDFCVKATALDARRLGFRTRVILDGCRGIDPKPAEAELLAAGVELQRRPMTMTTKEQLRDAMEFLNEARIAAKDAQRLGADAVVRIKAALGTEHPAFGFAVEVHQHGEVSAARAEQALEALPKEGV